MAQSKTRNLDLDDRQGVLGIFELGIFKFLYF